MFIVSNFNYCPLVCFFTSRESIDKIDKIRERSLRCVLKDHIFNHKNLLLKSGFDWLMIELFKILKGMTPNYLCDFHVYADTPYDTKDKCKSIQPLKKMTTYGLSSFQYYGAHVWNLLPINIKAAQSLQEFKSLIRSLPGSTRSCHICIALFWLMYCTLRTETVGVAAMWSPCHCHNLWCRGVIRVTAPLFYVYTPNEYICRVSDENTRTDTLSDWL